tara:strand:+ start:134 stop:265 length:132 start_codon:yes stop_codon:yes gene_type:complete
VRDAYINLNLQANLPYKRRFFYITVGKNNVFGAGLRRVNVKNS